MLREVWRAREGFAQGVTFVLVSAESRVLPWGKMSFQNEGTGVLLEAQGRQVSHGVRWEQPVVGRVLREGYYPPQGLAQE